MGEMCTRHQVSENIPVTIFRSIFGVFASLCIPDDSHRLAPPPVLGLSSILVDRSVAVHGQRSGEGRNQDMNTPEPHPKQEPDLQLLN